MRAVAVVGPTASGKSELAMEIALRFGGEIISVDSMQVYRGLDIGTAKPSRADLARVPHNLIDCVDVGFDFSVADFQMAGRAIIERLDLEGKPAVICGGSGLHFRALVDPLEFPPTDPVVRNALVVMEHQELVDELLSVDPDADEHVDLANPRRVLRAVEIFRLTGGIPSSRADGIVAADVRDYRPHIPFVGIGVDPDKDLARRVEARLDAMIESGWLEEVERFGDSLGKTAALALGYAKLRRVIYGEIDFQNARDEIFLDTLALAKRQRTFFRRDPRIKWLPWHDDADKRVELAIALLEEAEWSS